VIGPIPREYFGIHFHNPEKLPAVLPIDFGSWRTWDSGVTWEHLEPKPGQWDFSRLDQVVDIAQRNNIQLLYTFGIVPRWASSRPDDPFVYGPGGAAKPRNIADWENYVRTVAMRYKGRIKYYELWNEPSVTELEPNPKGFWHNSAADLLELGVAAKRVLQQVDPNAKLLSPGFVGGFTRIDLYFKQGGSRAIGTADIVAFHFYSPSPERMFTYIDKMKALLEQRGIGDRPLWNTETGYTISSKKNVGDEVYMPNQETAAAYLSRSLILGAAKGLERFYWYAYEGESSGMSVNGQMDLRGFAYATTMRWLKGAMLEGCASPDSVKWVCQLSRGSRKAWIAWATSGDADFIVNGGASPAVEFETISGQVNTLDSHGGPIPLGISPILVKTDSGAWSN